MYALKPSVSSKVQLVGAALYGRAVQSFEGAILLAERGLIAPARSLVRNCAETAIAIGALANDEHFVRALIEAHQNHRLSHANAILNDPESCQELGPEQIDKLKQVVLKVTEEYHPERPRGIRWEQAAKVAKMDALYVTTYRMTGGDAVHTTMLALDRHVEVDERGRIAQLIFRPETQDLEQTLSMAANALLHAMDAISRVAPGEGFHETVGSCLKQLAALQRLQ